MTPFQRLQSLKDYALHLKVGTIAADSHNKPLQ
jgi:hypothetical protein